LSAKPAARTGSGDATNTTPMRPIVDRHLITVEASQAGFIATLRLG
jgi:hypothetical protein